MQLQLLSQIPFVSYVVDVLNAYTHKCMYIVYIFRLVFSRLVSSHQPRFECEVNEKGFCNDLMIFRIVQIEQITGETAFYGEL